MTSISERFLFPPDVVPHTHFLPKHAFIMATVNGALKSGNASLRIAEIGSWLGASTLLWSESILRFGGPQAAAGSSVLSIDSWNPILSSEDLQSAKYQFFANAAKNDVAYNIYLHNAKAGSEAYGVPIDHIRGVSEDTLPGLGEDVFDIVYVDAGHYYDDASIDIAHAKRMTRIGGIICGDDLNLLMEEVDIPTARANANRDLVEDPRTGKFFHPGVTLAVGEAFDAVGTCGGFWAVRKTATDAFTAQEVRFDGLFIPSFLTEADQALFCDSVRPYYPAGFAAPHPTVPLI
ncbi:hypothetical protein CU669_10880 [Paramagnetospirillum kuznetsovii]|uniref:Class I SAM-dependent methyltransferase n=1 Tax=Paramagnetospirillum kuznetsovii TaxID=2053833 RepID=A0A364NXN2_9PROT|nr:class I SAM-dependent methyltransferase [Paramagnetospirillum kuznetsovii]RAU21803.1 hypothetical protein CU669_10880 [Paramagnetospirillum kuznetsovii]